MEPLTPEQLKETVKLAETAGENLGLSLEEFMAVHQTQHCLQIQKLEAEVAGLKATLIALIEKLSPNTPNQEPQEDWN